MNLEVISRKPKSVSVTKPKLVFVHGICVGAWVWDEHFLPYFADHGYEAHALSLRGHGESEGKERLLTWSLADYSNDLDEVVRSLEGPVVVIGHSLGGAVVQNWLRAGRSRDKAVGTALLASVPPWGLACSAMCMGAFSPDLYREISIMLMMGTVGANKDILRRALFSKSASDEIFNKLWLKAGGESLVVGAEVQGLLPFAPLPWTTRLPMFVGGASEDRFIPSFEVYRTALYYGVEAVVARDLAHAIMVDTNWENMAKSLLSWVEEL